MMEVERIAEEIYRVGSESSTTSYVVDLGVPKCTCTNWATQRNKLVSIARREGRPDNSVTYDCKHVREARAHTSDPIMDKAAQNQKIKDEIVSQYTKKEKDRTRENLAAIFEELKDA